LYDELCDEKRFTKSVDFQLKEVRHGLGEGLFTADTIEDSWKLAHRLLIPAFGPLAIRDMFDQMHDIASQLVLKIARLPEDTPFNASEDFTRLALDTIALCAMGVSYNSEIWKSMSLIMS